MGASLLVFANKQDIPGSMTVEDIQRVRITTYSPKQALAKTKLFSTLANLLPTLSYRPWTSNP